MSCSAFSGGDPRGPLVERKGSTSGSRKVPSLRGHAPRFRCFRWRRTFLPQTTSTSCTNPETGTIPREKCIGFDVGLRGDVKLSWLLVCVFFFCQVRLLIRCSCGVRRIIRVSRLLRLLLRFEGSVWRNVSCVVMYDWRRGVAAGWELVGDVGSASRRLRL